MPATAPPITCCRVCGNTRLVPCVSLGPQFLSSVFPEELQYRATLPRYPLDLVMCEVRDGRHCGLVQLGHQLDLSAMYQAYPYTSSTNSSMPTILKDVADSGRALGHLRAGDLIVDIGANDGTLLSAFQAQGYELLGIDPAQNVTPVFTDRRYTHLRQAFSAAAFNAVAARKARLIFSIAMFYHLADPVRFAREVAACLDEEGAWIIQMAYLPAMLRTTMYDNIVHEHHGYYAVHQMRWIMAAADLEIFDVTLNDVYGGSFRVFVKKRGCRRFPTTPRYREVVAAEHTAGIFDPATYRAFAQRVAATATALRQLCRTLRSDGRTIWVYGASTKGNTILQYVGVGSEELTAAADANPFKWGKYLIGADVPIRDEATMRAARPEYLLVLPYSFLEGFLRREADLVATGTKFIVPLPEVRLVP